MDHLRIELDALPPTEYSSNRSQGSYWIKKKARDTALNDIGVALNQAGWHRSSSPPLQKAHLTITFYLPTKGKRDHDGLISRMKPLLDALTAPTYNKDRTVRKHGYGVLVDDDLNCIGFPEYRYEYRPRQPGTVIDIIEVKL